MGAADGEDHMTGVVRIWRAVRRWPAWAKVASAITAVFLLIAWVSDARNDRPHAEQADVSDHTAGSPTADSPATVTTRPTSAPITGTAGSTVRSVVDGDTLTLTDGRTVRLAQVDAPATGECFGSESTAALAALAADRIVTLRRPTDAPAKDAYGRTLADVIIDGIGVNETLVRDGAAEWYEHYAHEDPELANRLRAAEAEASAAGRGLWSSCSTVSPFVGATPTTPADGAPGSGGCHPAHPDDCIPPAPPDLDCSDIRHPVRVDLAHGDPHGLDGNHDGLGCESFG